MNYDEASNYWIKKDSTAVHMDSAQLKVKIDDFLKSHNTCALATGCDDFVRCTPLEYNYLDGFIYIFSEGGLKFKALKKNHHIALAIYESYDGFGKLKSLQLEGNLEIIDPFSEEYLKLLEYKKIPVEAMKKLPQAMHLLKISPVTCDYLDSDLKKEGFSTRQHLDY